MIYKSKDIEIGTIEIATNEIQQNLYKHCNENINILLEKLGHDSPGDSHY